MSIQQTELPFGVQLCRDARNMIDIPCVLLPLDIYLAAAFHLELRHASFPAHTPSSKLQLIQPAFYYSENGDGGLVQIQAGQLLYIGREDINFRLGKRVSREHCNIEFQPGGETVTICDTSTYGTYIIKR